MAQLLLPLALSEYLASIGLVATEALTEVGIGEGLASTASKAGLGLATGFLGSEINDSLLSLVGDEKVQKVQKSFSELLQEAQGITSQDPAFFLKKRAEEKKGQKVSKTLNFNEFNDHLTSDALDQDVIKTNDAIVPPLLTNQPTTSSSSTKYTVQDLVHFITDYAAGIAEQAIKQEQIDKEAVLNNTIAKNPNKYVDIAKSLGSFLSTKVPSNQEYIKIAEVYNGFGLELDRVNMLFDPNKKLLYFTFFDETNTEFLMYQTTGIIIPAMSGTVFMGPKSANNAFPGSKMPAGNTAYTDLYSMYHDQSYINGPSLTGDYKYISRLTQNYNKMSSYDQKLAKIGILYFSTMGHIISRISNNDLTTDEDAVGAYELVHDPQTLGPFDKPNVNIPTKEEFYKNFNTQLNDIGLNKLSNLNNSLVVSEIGNISIELL